MLLSVESVNTNQYGVLLDIYEIGGKRRIVKPPILPYFYSLTPRPNSTPVRKRLLSTLEEVKLFECQFQDTRTLEGRRDAESLEDNIPLVQRIAIDVATISQVLRRRFRRGTPNRSPKDWAPIRKKT